MHVAERTLHDLGYPEVLRALASRCRTEPGKTRALARPFLGSTEEVLNALSLVEEARRLLAEPLSLPLGGVTDVRPALGRAAKGAMLEPAELVAITHVLFAFERTRQTAEERKEALPSLAALAHRIPELERLATRLDRSFESGDQLSDRASPELREARERARALHRAIKARIDKLLRDEKFAANLREPYFSLRNERYVVPVLAQSRAEVPGIVHNASQSGQTLFVEPQELIGLGNDLAIAQSLVLEEERRILQELSSAVGREADAISAGVEACAALDEAEAAARLANDLGSHRPEIDLHGNEIALLALRHPLLALRGGEVVPNDVRLSGVVRAMVVSGPNAGGKTVTITAVGLCALMLRSGLLPPVENGSKLPLFASIHSAVGDAQDLALGLSTFSAHVMELKRIAEAAGPGALVLIDEIAADTDPREGAAIAIAVLEDLLDRGAIVAVTTHLEELKALAHMDGRFLNARVGLDSRRMAPTYKLQLGAAGASSAIDIAGRVGLPERICSRARELTLGAGGPLAKALASAEEERRKLAEQQERAREEESAARAARERLEGDLEEMRKRRREEELRFREALAAELEFAQKQVRELIEAIKARDSSKEAAAAAKELAERQAEQARAARALRTEESQEEAPSGPPELRAGGWVRHLSLGREVEIVEVDGAHAVVSAGVLRMRVPVSELAAARSPRPRAGFPGGERERSRMARASGVSPGELPVSHATCDLRGMRAEEALRAVEQFLDRGFREGAEAVTVVHGHGTGALKQSLRTYLEASPYVRSHRPGDAEEGGDGVTVVSLRS
ncbi:MAG: Smr/MutS family protein [Myxococcales bacterium]|nr:Smr/MutS family protein [Myxococcales bacterium]